MLEIIQRAPKAVFLQVRSDWLKICEGDHCRASLIRVFEHLTDCLLTVNRKGIAEIPDPLPVVETTVKQLSELMVELFQEEKIRKELQWLDQKGWINIVQHENGKPARYRLNASAIGAAVCEYFYTPDRPENRPVLIGKQAGSGLKTGRSGDGTPYILSSELTEHTDTLTRERARDETEPEKPSEDLRIDRWIHESAQAAGKTCGVFTKREREFLIEHNSSDIRERITDAISDANSGGDVRGLVLGAVDFGRQGAATRSPMPRTGFQSSRPTNASYGPPQRERRQTTEELIARLERNLVNLK